MIRCRAIQVVHWASSYVLFSFIAISSPCHAQDAVLEEAQQQKAQQQTAQRQTAQQRLAAERAALRAAQLQAAQRRAGQQFGAQQFGVQGDFAWAPQQGAFQARLGQPARAAMRVDVINVRNLAAIEQREKNFLRRLFKLSDQQADELNKLGDVALLTDEAMQNKINQAVQRAARAVPGPGLQLQRQPADIISSDAEGVRAFLHELREKYSALLAPDQQAIYQAECEARDEFQRQTCAEAMAVLIAEPLHLSDEQIAAITAEFVQSRILDEVAQYIPSNNSIPPLPEAMMVKHLSAEQTLIFNRLRMTIPNRTNRVLVNGVAIP